jgi:hypothetical protein
LMASRSNTPFECPVSCEFDDCDPLKRLRIVS